MNRNWQTLLGMAAGVLVAGCTLGSLVGCSSNASTASSRPTAAQLKEGLNILEMRDPSLGLSAAYMQNGRVVYIETRVGSLKPEVYRNDAPDEPANEMDMRVVDQNNYTFYAVRGGDNYADPSWSADIVRSYTPTAPDTNRALDMTIALQGGAGAGPGGARELQGPRVPPERFPRQGQPGDGSRIAQEAGGARGEARDPLAGAALLRHLQQRRLDRGLCLQVVEALRRAHVVLCRVALGDHDVCLLLGRSGQHLGVRNHRLQPRHVPRRVEHER